jgi:hypothetical protein
MQAPENAVSQNSSLPAAPALQRTAQTMEAT